MPGCKLALAVSAIDDKINLISFAGLRRQSAVCETGADVYYNSPSNSPDIQIVAKRHSLREEYMMTRMLKLLTAAAVVVGASVILFDPIFQGLAISLMAGEVASTVLSRMTVPVLYYLSERGNERAVRPVSEDLVPAER